MEPEVNYYPVTGLEGQQKIGDVKTNVPARKLEVVNESLTSATGEKLSTVTAGEKTDASMLHYHSGSMTAGTGSKAINNTTAITIAHGLGVIPTLVTFYAATSIGTVLATSFGSYDGVNNACVASWIEASTGTLKNSTVSSNIINLRDDGDTVKFRCTATFDAVNITLTISNNDNSGDSRNYHWTAYK